MGNCRVLVIDADWPALSVTVRVTCWLLAWRRCAWWWESSCYRAEPSPKFQV